MDKPPEEAAAQMSKTIQLFRTSGGSRIYQVPLDVFPGYPGYVYLVLAEDAGRGEAYRVLIDTGSGIGDSNQQLERGLRDISEREGRELGLADLTHVLITHAHIDHFGGLGYIRPRTPAKIGVHELDRRILTHYEERLVVVGRRLDEFLIEAGVTDERRAYLLQMYLMTKSLYHSVKVDFTYEAVGMQVGPFKFLHVPGHCAGHVVARLDDVLFTGDHILAHTSPHQSPERLTLSTGLDHYLHSLEALRGWVGGIRIGLGGHEQPMTGIPARIDAIRQLHAERLDRVLDLLAEPHTTAEVSHGLFGEVHGYNTLLALEEAGAHIEYLAQRGLLGIANLAELEGGNRASIQYYRLNGD
ncbi:MAG TPA: MBL fold metallo-hydrolase [Anaerolineales bacterium]